MEPLPSSDNPEPDDAGWTTTLVPEKKPAPKRKRKGIPRYNVILWDSDDHSYEYVERMLRELFGHTPEECHKMAETVNAEGKVVVLTTTKEHAELKRDQILAYGKDESDQNCKGSMYATIESAE
ncbi:MAG: ATP-dependent Clp protease adaptor ClpS [Planctomycetes bacterium]|nr:ATP-dependent Clp protease adaptor ClpS [Planctomycetota bacterium]